MTSKRVLIIEDEEIVRRLAVRSLERDGYEIATACSGKEAMNLARAGSFVPDLVLCDLKLTDVQGHWLIEELKAFWPASGVIFMSGSGIVGREQLPSWAAYLEKPFTSSELRAIVNQALSPAPLRNS